MLRVYNFFRIGVILAAVSLACVTQGSAQTYPNVGTYPIPMQPNPPGTTFPYQDPVSGANFNFDGTNSQNPIIGAGTQTVGSVTYNLQTLTNSTSITFKGQNYTVYSAVPQTATIASAYSNCSQYYSSAALTGIDFTIPAGNQINSGNPTTVASTPVTSQYTNAMVYLTTPPTDQNSLFFIPNLPNSTGSHTGLTANIYFVGDPYIGKSGYQPSGPTYHLTPYGWAADPRNVNQSYPVQKLNADGGTTQGEAVIQANPPFNLWKHSIQGVDAYWNGTSQTTIATQVMQIVNADSSYPFPPSQGTSNYLNWLVTYNATTQTYTQNGLYLQVQPQPGFQRNLLNYYTAWGAADMYNLSSDLFVRADGTIELPAVQNAGTWQYAPIVAQTWDGSQRYALLNQTKSQVPSSQDTYPGFEVYLPGNVYLPGQAGVVTSYLNYWVWDNHGQLTARGPDTWLGLKVDSFNDVQVWDYATVNGSNTEPGGQANKPYMMGAVTSYSATPGQSQYDLRLEASNSFGVARLTSDQLQGKLYDASLYVNFNDGKGYQKGGTISYQWQPWTISSASQATWINSTDLYGAGVATLTYANTLGGQVAISAHTATWDSAGRALYWTGGGAITPSQWTTYNSSVNNQIWGNYFIEGNTATPNNYPNIQYLIVLNPAAYFTPGSGDWGTAANWSSGAVPDDNNNVYLLQNGTVTYKNTSATAPPLSMLQVDGGSTLQINSASPTGDLAAEMAVVGVGAQGTLTQSAGTMTLTDTLYLGHAAAGNGTYNLSGGTFTAASAQVGVYGTGTFTQSAGTTATLSGNLTLASQSGSTGTYNMQGGTFSASNATVGLNGTGTLNQSGGTATLSGTLTVTSTGTYNLSGGSMSVNTFVNSGQYTNTGGTLTYQQMSLQGGNFGGDLDNRTLLRGAGTITRNLTNNGTVMPGTAGTPGTLNVGGTYTAAATSNTVIQIASPGSFGQIIATGGTFAAGSTLTPTILGGYLPSINQTFRVVTGNFAGTLPTLAFTQISPTLFWQLVAGSVDLKAVGSYNGANLGLTPSQATVGNMLNGFASTTSGDMFTVLNAIDALTTNQQVAAAYNDISPAKYAALPTLTMPVTHLQFQYLQNRLARQRWEAELGRDVVSSGGGGFMKGFNFGYEDKMYLASSSFTLSDAGTPLIRQGSEHRWGIYLEPMANWGSLQPTTNMVGYRYKNFGFTLGADYWIMDNWLLGVNTGYSKTLTDMGGTGGDINANSIPFNAYTAFFLQGFYVNATSGYTYNNYDMERNIAFGTINRTAQANTSGNQFQAAAETGYDFKVGKAIVGPTVSLQYATLTTAGFTESNAGALSLKVGSQTADSLQTGVGARASYRAKVGNVNVKPQLAVVWQHEFSNNTRGVNARLAQGSSTMNFRTDKIGQDFAVVSADISTRISKNLVANVSYTAEVGRSRSSNQGVNLGLRLEF